MIVMASSDHRAAKKRRRTTRFPFPWRELSPKAVALHAGCTACFGQWPLCEFLLLPVVKRRMPLRQEQAWRREDHARRKLERYLPTLGSIARARATSASPPARSPDCCLATPRL